MKRRLLAGFAAMAMALSLAACNNGGGSSTTSGNTSGGGDSSKTEAPVTVTWFWREGGDPQVPEDDYICKYILENANIKYIHSTPIGQTVEERLSAMLATGDVPDIAESWNEYTVKLRDYEAILPIDQFVEGGQLENVVKNQYRFDEAYKTMKLTDGHAWAVPATYSAYNGPTPYIRYDWLENLGLEAPKTFEELADVLEAFTNNDPDGNGQNDTVGTSYGGVYSGFANNFGAGASTWYITEDGGIEMGLFTDRMKPYLEYMKGLIESGALDRDITDKEELGSKHSNNVKAGKIGFSFGYMNAAFNDDIRKIQPEADFRPLETIPTGVYDVGYLPTSGLQRQQYVIFKKPQDEGRLDAVLKLMNFLADDGGDPTKVDWDAPYWPANYGEKGVSWDVIDGVFQTGANNTEIKANIEGKGWLGGQARRWRTMSMQLALDTAITEAQAADNKVIATYTNMIDCPQEPGYELQVDCAEKPATYAEFMQNFNLAWDSLWMKAWLGDIDIDEAIKQGRESVLSYGYEEQKQALWDLYDGLGLLEDIKK